ncbi:acyltransferase family protein, partial [Pseudomonas synxantha]
MNLNEPAKIPAKALVSTTVRLQTAFRRDVQGLRAIAVLVVMLFHACKTWLPSGFIGVDVFFVISGYIICSLIIDGKTEFSWSAFYWGRT